MARRNRILSWFVISASLLCGAAAQTGRIAFTSDRSGSWQIYTMNPDGSDQVQVTNLTLTDEDLLVPSISPNGRQIAFDYNSGDGPDLYLVNVDGTGLHALTNDHLSLWPRWSPDGKRIIFSGVSQKGTAVLITIATDGSGKRKTLTTDLWAKRRRCLHAGRQADCIRQPDGRFGFSSLDHECRWLTPAAANPRTLESTIVERIARREEHLGIHQSKLSPGSWQPHYCHEPRRQRTEATGTDVKVSSRPVSRASRRMGQKLPSLATVSAPTLIRSLTGHGTSSPSTRMARS